MGVSYHSVEIGRAGSDMRVETNAGMHEMTVRDPNWERTLRLKFGRGGLFLNQKLCPILR